MTAVEYLRAKAWLTKDCMKCTQCPLSKERNRTGLNCERLQIEMPEEAIRIVQEEMKRRQII
ncbi:MAG: hypothetical protein IJH92_03080 [Mogibacterium sp.]|nr:hypothetical protein [Mogibacterium sp.]